MLPSPKGAGCLTCMSREKSCQITFTCLCTYITYIYRVTTKFPRNSSRIIQGYFHDFQECQDLMETSQFNGQVLQCASQKDIDKRM